MQRRLAAIIAADVVGYSRLMGEDETRTLAALTRFRDEVLEPEVDNRGGQIVKRMGDGWFIEFNTASDAVHFAIDLQNALCNHDIIQLRVGVHIGDVTFQDDDLYGGGVNVAARLEALAEPGQVVISDTVHNSLDGVSAAVFRGGDAVALKNIARPIPVWHWAPEDTKLTPPVEAQTGPESGPETSEAEKPSIAVLPFTNLSSDPEQEFFADGVVEDLIMALTRFAWLFVISRNSCFTYKGRTVQTSQVARDLGVRYVVEGSVRQSSTRIRVTTKLIDAAHDRHVWTESYDRPTGDLFDIQDEITQAITGVMVPALSTAERDRCQRSTRPSLDAWEAYQKGLAFYYRPFSQEDNAAAKHLFEQSIALDPEFSDAHAMIAMMGVYALNSGQSSFAGTRQQILATAAQAAHSAVHKDDSNALAHIAMGRVAELSGNYETAIAECETAISLNPNLAVAHHELGFVLNNFGRLAEAVTHHDAAIRLSPNDPSRWNFHFLKGVALFGMDEFDKSVASLKEGSRLRPAAFWPHLGMAACFVGLGKMPDAEKAVRDGLQRNPDWTLKKMTATFETFPGDHLQRWIGNLRLAGLPEG